MEQAVAAREDVDERTELGDVHDLAGVHRADARRSAGRGSARSGAAPPRPRRRPSSRSRRCPTTPSSLTEMSAPVSCLIVLMTLPFGPITSPILSIGISKLTIFGAVGAHVVARRGDRAVHHLEDLQPGVLGLAAAPAPSTSAGMPVDLRVELERGDELRGAGDLEVHVAERVLGAEDVGERRVLALGVHEAHRDAGDRRLDRHAGVHQRQRRAAHRRHRRRAVRREHVGDDAQRVRPLVDVGTTGTSARSASAP